MRTAQTVTQKREQMANYTVSEFEEILKTIKTFTYTSYKGVEFTESAADYSEDEVDLNTVTSLMEEYGSITLNLENGEKIETYSDENSLYHDGSEIGQIFEIGDQLFRRVGSYSSHDSDYWEDIFEVTKEVKLVPTVFYHVKK